MTTSQAAIREMKRAMHDRSGKLPLRPGVFPDYGAPIVRKGSVGRDLVLARWSVGPLESVVRALEPVASLVSIADADHSFHVPARSKDHPGPIGELGAGSYGPSRRTVEQARWSSGPLRRR